MTLEPMRNWRRDVSKDFPPCRSLVRRFYRTLNDPSTSGDAIAPHEDLFAAQRRVAQRRDHGVGRRGGNLDEREPFGDLDRADVARADRASLAIAPTRSAGRIPPLRPMTDEDRARRRHPLRRGARAGRGACSRSRAKTGTCSSGSPPRRRRRRARFVGELGSPPRRYRARRGRRPAIRRRAGTLEFAARKRLFERRARQFEPARAQVGDGRQPTRS